MARWCAVVRKTFSDSRLTPHSQGCNVVLVRPTSGRNGRTEAMRTIERNYRKNPHTASFLQTFHSGISSTGRNYRAEMAADDADALALEAAQDDLLNLVPETAPAFTQSPAQIK